MSSNHRIGSTGSSGREAWSQDYNEKRDTHSVSYGEYQKDYDFKDGKTQGQSEGCWPTFSRGIGGMWATRTMTKKEDREVYVRTTLRELVIYFIFLAIICVITFGMTSETMYYYTKVLSDLFLESPFPDTKNTFRGSTQVMDFWRFSESVLLGGLYWENWYDPAMTPINQDDRNILYENRLLGVPRLRQLRVRNDSCEVPDSFGQVIKQCYSVYETKAEDPNPFGPGVGPEWTYHDSESEMETGTHWGKVSVYSGRGSYKDLSLKQNESRIILADLRDNLWIDRGTRVVFIDFTVYNANINLFCVIRLLFELPATGGVIPSWSFRTVKLLRYVTVFDYFVLGCECIFIFFVIYYIIEEMIEISKLKCSYFSSWWNILDILVLLLCLLCIFFNVYLTLTIEPKLKELLQNPNAFPDFDSVSWLHSQFNSTVAVCVFFSWFKLFKYISFNKTMTQLSSTISRCAKDVAGFAIMFFIVFFAFAQLGYLLFGTQVRDFNKIINSCFTLLRTILGDFNFHDIEEANRILGPLFFISYVFFVFFVLLNMFLAIINDTYSEVKAEIAGQRNEFEIGDYFKRGYNNMLGKLGRRDKLIDIENALKLSDANSDGMLTFDEIRVNLKKCNFSDMEIEMFFARYDMDGNRLLETEEVKRMLTDIEGKRLELESQGQGQVPLDAVVRPQSTRDIMTARRARSAGRIPGVASDEFIGLTRRVDRMENSVGSIVNKIDNVIFKLDHMEKSKQKKKESMGKMLDHIMEDDNYDEKDKRKQLEKIVRDELDCLDD